jgi:hypothetical protein
MATVPNRYYNSPWIRDAAANLASALAPEDPDKKLAADKMRFELQREQLLAQQQDEDRTRRLGQFQALGDIVAAAGQQPDMSTATFGTQEEQDAGPTHAVVPDNIGANVDTAVQKALTDVNDLRRDLERQREETARFIAELHRQQSEEHDARTAGRGTPLDISPADDLALGDAVDDWATKRGINLDPALRGAMKNYSSKVYQGSRNSTNAIDAAVAFFFGNNPNTQPYVHHSFWPDREGSYQLRGNKTLEELQREIPANFGMPPQAAAAGPGGLPPITTFRTP